MQTYNELQAFLEDVQQRKMDLNDQKNALIMKRQTLQDAYEDAVVNGEGIKEAHAAIIDNENEIDIYNDHISILQDRVKTSSKVKELAKAVWDDCHHTVQGVRNNYIAQADKVEKIKNDYLRELSILGEIARVGEKYSFYAAEANHYIPGQSVHVGLNADKFKAVAIDAHQVRETYKNGRNKQ